MTVDLFGENPQPERIVIKEPEPVKKEAVHKNIKTEKINKNLPIPTLTTKGKLRNKIKEEEKAAIALINANIQLEKDKEQAILDDKLAIEKAEAHALNEINRKLRNTYVTRPVWRTALFGISGSRESGKTPEQIEIENSKAEMKKKKKELKKKEMEDNEKFFNDEDDD